MKQHRPHAFIKSIQRRLDEITDTIRETAASQGDSIQCRRGCAHCCSEPVYAVKLEADLIADRVRELPPGERATIEANLRDRVATLAASGLLRFVEPHVIPYRRLQIACPLLTAEGECSMYDDRPMGCRMHLARKPAEPYCRDNDARLRQQFVETGRLVAPSMATLIARGDAQYDHFILLLHRALFGEAPSSAAATHVSAFEQDPLGRTVRRMPP